MTDFDKTVNRRNTNSLKWDVDDNELPMWVADMDFPTAPCVKQAILNKAADGIFGYQIVPRQWYDAICNWWRDRHGWNIDPQWLCFCTGVVPAITCGVKRLTNVGDKVLVLTPVYDIFYHSIVNTGRQVCECPLDYADGVYSVNFDLLDRLLSDPLCTMMILCNPHNPVGKVWSGSELARVGELCRKYGVTVLSDEIHCDITATGVDYVPFGSVSPVCRDISVTAISPSKAFNIAVLQSAAVCVPNKSLRDKMVRGLNSDELAEPNAFAIEATVAAYTEGAQWLDELRQYIDGNRAYAAEFFASRLGKLRLVGQDATYLLWVDCSALTDDSARLCEFVRSSTGLYLSDGAKYRGNGKYFVRINAACPRCVLADGLQRFERAVRLYAQSDGGK